MTASGNAIRSSAPHVPGRRRWRRCTVAAVAVVVLSGSASGGSGGPAALLGAEEASAARWVGSVEGKAEKSTRWVSGGSTSHGDFWFDVERGGRVRGEAVVAYDPTFEAEGLNAVIAYVQSLASVPVSALPTGPLLGILTTLTVNELNTAVYVRASFPQPMAVRRVPISGTLRGGRLSLSAGGASRKGVPFRAFLTRLKAEKFVTAGSLAVPALFPRSAQVTRGHATAVSQGQSGTTKKGGVLTQTSSYWTAHRVGKG